MIILGGRYKERMINKTKTVKVVARITARPDTIEDLSSLLLHLVEESRKENGCISYQLLQNKTDPKDFTVVEEWESDSAIDNHFTTPHMQDALPRAASLLAREPEISRYYILG
jgi:quinol monooxygenase YgiN